MKKRVTALLLAGLLAAPAAHAQEMPGVGGALVFVGTLPILLVIVVGEALVFRRMLRLRTGRALGTSLAANVGSSFLFASSFAGMTDSAGGPNWFLVLCFMIGIELGIVFLLNLWLLSDPIGVPVLHHRRLAKVVVLTNLCSYPIALLLYILLLAL